METQIIFINERLTETNKKQVVILDFKNEKLDITKLLQFITSEDEPKELARIYEEIKEEYVGYILTDKNLVYDKELIKHYYYLSELITVLKKCKPIN